MTNNSFLLTGVTLGISCLVLSLSGPSHAQAGDRTEMLYRADADGDGNIAWTELIGLRADTFTHLDHNGDGVLNDADKIGRALADRFERTMEGMLPIYDQDGNGEITREEMRTAPAPLFEAGDIDNDGVLTGLELARLQAAETLP